MNRTLVVVSLIAAIVAHAQGQGVERGGSQGKPPAVEPRGGPPTLPPLGTTPKPAIANAKPVRSCESLAKVHYRTRQLSRLPSIRGIQAFAA